MNYFYYKNVVIENDQLIRKKYFLIYIIFNVVEKNQSSFNEIFCCDTFVGGILFSFADVLLLLLMTL